MGTKDGFIGEVSTTVPFIRFLKYTRNATYIAFLLTFFSMPMMVISAEIHKSGQLMYSVVSLWFGLFVWAFLAFARVAYLFGLLLKPKSKPFIPG